MQQKCGRSCGVPEICFSKADVARLVLRVLRGMPFVTLFVLVTPSASRERYSALLENVG